MPVLIPNVCGELKSNHFILFKTKYLTTNNTIFIQCHSDAFEGITQIKVKMFKDGPMSAKLHAMTSLSKAQLIEDYNRTNTKRLRSINSLRREIEVPETDDGELKIAIDKLKKEGANLKKELRRNGQMMNEMAKLKFPELLARINGNAFTCRMTQICCTMKDKVQEVTFFLNNGELMTYSVNRTDGKPPTVIDNPVWVNDFDIYRNKQPSVFGANSAYHDDAQEDEKKDRGNPYRGRGRGRGGRGLSNNSNYRGRWNYNN